MADMGRKKEHEEEEAAGEEPCVWKGAMWLGVVSYSLYLLVSVEDTWWGRAKQMLTALFLIALTIKFHASWSDGGGDEGDDESSVHAEDDSTVLGEEEEVLVEEEGKTKPSEVVMTQNALERLHQQVERIKKVTGTPPSPKSAEGSAEMTIQTILDEVKHLQTEVGVSPRSPPEREGNDNDSEEFARIQYDLQYDIQMLADAVGVPF